MSGHLCELCLEFTGDLISSGFKSLDSYPHGRWTTEYADVRHGSWGPGFHHHETLEELKASSSSCTLCSLILDVGTTLPSTVGITEGWLGLYPWSSRLGEQTGTSFITVFSGSVQYTYWGGFLGKIPPQVLNICSERPWTRESTFPPHSRQSRLVGGAPGVFRHVPSNPDNPSAFDTARAWLKECIDHHGVECPRGGFDARILPGKLIDLGTLPTAIPRLCTPASWDVNIPLSYAALTHCWGGEVPGRTLQANVNARSDGAGIDVAELPANFCGAIRITRELGIRFLWIDALCIVQDSAEIWREEAAKMAAIYSSAVVVVSALDSKSSTAGILNSDRVSSVRLDDTHFVQKNLPLFQQDVAACPVNGRGWCMQERLLAPALLHYGKEQLFWECRAYHAYEDGRLSMEGGTLDGEIGKFITLRQRISQSPSDGWRTWYRLVEEYSKRDLGQKSDKFPALAGAAAIFRKARGEGTYVAGIWKEDIVQGLVWGAHYYHYPSRKVPGYLISDACAVLTRPPVRRAPSWSWASVDGPILFGWTVHSSYCDFEVLDVVMSAGLDDYVEPAPMGLLSLRAKVMEGRYEPHDGSQDGGALVLETGNDGEATRLTTCVMDFDRKSARGCWVMSINPPSVVWLLLVLEKQAEGSFKRIGLCVAWNPGSPNGKEHAVLSQNFMTQDITLV